MRPLEIYLKGFKGIRDGMGRAEIRHNLRPYRGLVAVVGPNGSGKTTIMDNLHPFNIMPYRLKPGAGGYSERSFSYYDQTYGDAEKELTWEHAGAQYVTQIFIKGSTKTPSMKSFLFTLVDGLRAPYVAPDGTKSDGKTTTYDQCVRAVMGDPQMFFTAIFAAQERRRITDYGVTDMKTLLSEMLALERELMLSAAAIKHAGNLQVQLDSFQPRLRALEAAQAELASKEAELATKQGAHAAAITAQAQARAALATAQRAIGEAKARALQRDQTRVQRNLATQAVQAAEREIREAEQRLTQEMATARQHAGGADLASDIGIIQTRIAGLRTRIQGYEQALAAAPDAAAAAAELDAAERAQADFGNRLAAARQVLDGLADARSAFQTIDNSLASLVREGTTVRETLAAAKVQGALVDRVPCAGTEYNSSCELLASARSAKTTQAQKQAKVDELLASYATQKAARPAAEARVLQQGVAEAEVSRIEAERQGLQTTLQTAQARHRAVSAAGETQASLTAARRDLVAAEGELTAKRTAADARRQEGDQRVLEAQQAHAVAQAERRTRLQAAQDSLATIPEEASTDDFAAAERAAVQAEALVTQEDGRVAQIGQDIGRTESAITIARAGVTAGEGVVRDVAALSEDLAWWRLLGKALGKDGVVALAIDDAGPTISTTCNDLLKTCYGPRFSIRFDTQSERKDGSFKETFDIRVFDATSDEDKSILETSGGERVWLNDGITCSFALFLGDQMGSDFKVRFSDEADGALDAARKEDYMRMKRAVAALGHYDTEFMITHTPALIDKADMVLDVGLLRAA